MIQSGKISHRCVQLLRFLVHSRRSQVGNQEEPSEGVIHVFALGDLEKAVDDKAVEMPLHQVDKDILSIEPISVCPLVCFKLKMNCRTACLQ